MKTATESPADKEDLLRWRQMWNDWLTRKIYFKEDHYKIISWWGRSSSMKTATESPADKEDLLRWRPLLNHQLMRKIYFHENRNWITSWYGRSTSMKTTAKSSADEEDLLPWRLQLNHQLMRKIYFHEDRCWISKEDLLRWKPACMTAESPAVRSSCSCTTNLYSTEVWSCHASAPGTPLAVSSWTDYF